MTKLVETVGSPEAVANNLDAYEGLTKVGLTRLQARCYALLSQNHAMAAADMAKQLNVSRTNLYSALNDMRTKGFITASFIISAHNYRAVPLVNAVKCYAAYQRTLIVDLIEKQYDT